MQALNYLGRYPTNDSIGALHFVREDSNEDYGYGAAVFDGSQGWQLANYLAKNLLVNLNVQLQSKVDQNGDVALKTV